MPRKLGPDAIPVDPTAAIEASRLLVNAICELRGLQSDKVISPAIDMALQAYGLPHDFPTQVLIAELNADQEQHHD